VAGRCDVTAASSAHLFTTSRYAAIRPSVRPSAVRSNSLRDRVEMTTHQDGDSSDLAPPATDTAPLTQSLGDVSGPSGAGRPETVAGTHFKAYSNRVPRTNCALRIKKCAPRISSGIYFLSTS